MSLNNYILMEQKSLKQVVMSIMRLYLIFKRKEFIILQLCILKYQSMKRNGIKKMVSGNINTQVGNMQLVGQKLVKNSISLKEMG